MTPSYVRTEAQFTGRYSKSTFETLRWAYKPVRGKALILISCGFLGRAVLLSNANLIGYWADSFCRHPACSRPPSFFSAFGNHDYLLLLSLSTIAGFLLTVIFRTGFSRLSAEAVSRFYDEVTLRTSRFPIEFFDTTPTGRIVTRFSTDYGNIFRLFGGPLAELATLAFDLICMVALITWASPYFLPVVILVAAGNYLVYRQNQDRLREQRRLLSYQRAPAVAHFAESLQGLSTIRVFSKQASFFRRFSELNQKFLEQKLRTTRATSWFSIQMSALASVALFGVGLLSYAFLSLQLFSLGSLGVAFGFIALSSNTIQNFFDWLSQLEEAMVGVERLDEYLRSPLEPGQLLPARSQFATPHPKLTPVAENAMSQSRLSSHSSAAVVFKDVWLRYAPHLPYVLKGISFEVDAGEKVGIIGRTGSGKSSLIQALFQFYPLDRGVISIAGLSPHLNVSEPPAAHQVDLSVFRRAIGWIPQEPVLFQGTVRENLTCLARPDSDLLSALDRVGLSDWLKGLPQGLQTPIAERGRNLSLGERQLLCMARCLLQNAPVVVMDEATSSVDPQSEEILVRATQQFFANSTQIIVAHRLSTLKDCHRILWLDQGRIRQYDSPRVILPLFLKHASNNLEAL